MNERIRPEAERPGPGRGGTIFDDTPGAVLPVTVTSGASVEHLPVGNMTVGEIRRRFRDRLNLDPRSQAVLDGHDVDNDVVVRPGQALMFTRRAGEKGSSLANAAALLAHLGWERDQPPAPDQSSIAIRGAEVTATSPEGQTASMPLDAFLGEAAPRSMDTGEVVMPAGIKAVLTEGRITVWVHETPPSVHRFNWIAPASPAAFGPGTEYRQVRLALPYLIILAVFATDPAGNLQLSSVNECFFRNDPLRSLDDSLHFPALLNCSRFVPPDGRPLSWICTQHLKPTPAMRQGELSRRMTASFEALRHCLLETGFNLSSEHHEHSSWFTESRQVDERISTVERWEQCSAEDPLFVLDVPWLPAGVSVRQAAGRIFKNHQAQARTPRTAGALARIVFNHQAQAV